MDKERLIDDKSKKDSYGKSNNKISDINVEFPVKSQTESLRKSEHLTMTQPDTGTISKVDEKEIPSSPSSASVPSSPSSKPSFSFTMKSFFRRHVPPSVTSGSSKSDTKSEDPLNPDAAVTSRTLSQIDPAMLSHKDDDENCRNGLTSNVDGSDTPPNSRRSVQISMDTENTHLLKRADERQLK